MIAPWVDAEVEYRRSRLFYAARVAPQSKGGRLIGRIRRAVVMGTLRAWRVVPSTKRMKEA